MTSRLLNRIPAALVLAVLSALLPSGSATASEATAESTAPATAPAPNERSYRLTASTPNLTFLLSSAVLLATAGSGQDQPTIYELHLGYRITPKDAVAVKAVTWKLKAPLGIPWGPFLANESEYYPGSLYESGVGLTYQRFLWKGLFGQVQVVPLVKSYRDDADERLMGGFRLYTSAHVGYYIPLFRQRVYLEPQVHCNYWPYETQGPPSFAGLDNKWDNNYFLFEPNLMVGLNFGRKREADGRFVF